MIVGRVIPIGPGFHRQLAELVGEPLPSTATVNQLTCDTHAVHYPSGRVVMFTKQVYTVIVTVYESELDFARNHTVNVEQDSREGNHYAN